MLAVCVPGWSGGIVSGVWVGRFAGCVTIWWGGVGSDAVSSWMVR